MRRASVPQRSRPAVCIDFKEPSRTSNRRELHPDSCHTVWGGRPRRRCSSKADLLSRCFHCWLQRNLTNPIDRQDHGVMIIRDKETNSGNYTACINGAVELIRPDSILPIPVSICVSAIAKFAVCMLSDLMAKIGINRTCAAL
jgi:hypothetical protein